MSVSSRFLTQLYFSRPMNTMHLFQHLPDPFNPTHGIPSTRHPHSHSLYSQLLPKVNTFLQIYPYNATSGYITTYSFTQVLPWHRTSERLRNESVRRPSDLHHTCCLWSQRWERNAHQIMVVMWDGTKASKTNLYTGLQHALHPLIIVIVYSHTVHCSVVTW